VYSTVDWLAHPPARAQPQSPRGTDHNERARCGCSTKRCGHEEMPRVEADGATRILLSSADVIVSLVAPHLSTRQILRLLGCNKRLHAVSGIELDLGKTAPTAVRAFEWHTRFGHRFHLVGLDIIRCDQTFFRKILHNFPALRRLTVRQPILDSGIGSLEPIAAAPALQSLSLVRAMHTGIVTWKDLAPLGSCVTLQSFTLQLPPASASRIENLDALGTCARLRVLDLRCCHLNVEELQRLASTGSAAAWALETLTLKECLLLPQHLTCLRGFSKLSHLDLSLNRTLTTTEGLELCPQLQVLVLTGCAYMEDITSLGHCAQLRTLYLTACDRKLTDVSCLASCGELRTLHLNHCKLVDDASALGGCPKLELLNLRCSGIDFESAPRPLNGRPRVIFDAAGERSVGVL